MRAHAAAAYPNCSRRQKTIKTQYSSERFSSPSSLSVADELVAEELVAEELWNPYSSAASTGASTGASLEHVAAAAGASQEAAAALEKATGTQSSSVMTIPSPLPG